MKTILRTLTHPFDIKGLEIRMFDPKEGGRLVWYGQELGMLFSNNMSPSLADYTSLPWTDVRLTFRPSEDTLLRSVWGPLKDRRRLFTLSKEEKDLLYVRAIETYRQAMSDEMTELFMRICNRVFKNEVVIRQANPHYIFKEAFTGVALTLKGFGLFNGETLTCLVGYSHKRDVFYCRYSRPGQPYVSFDRNEPIRDVILEMALHLEKTC